MLRRDTSKRSLSEIHLAVLLFGLAGLFGKWLTLSPTIIVLGRVFFASIILGLLLGLSKQKIKISSRKDYLYFLLLGFILSIHWISFFKSIQVSTVAVGLLSYSSFPVFTTFLEPLFFREKLAKRNIIYAFFCVIGVFFIIPKFDLSNSIYQGVLWGLFAGFTFSVLTILNRHLAQRYSGSLIAFFQDFVSTLLLIPFFFIIRPVLNTKNILLLCILGVFCTAGAHSLFIKGMKYIKAQTASIISSLEPVYGIVMAFLFLQEIPSLRTILGGIIILGTAFAVTLRGK
ncbi:MAG: DMT family transporter [Candidatus Aminicenantes bacterium]|nr:MAG: DMT family transporter [Candidatus Aminicenantes bacterium]